MTKNLRLNGKTVLVSGAGGGIGKAISLRSAAEGACVILGGRSLEAMNAVAEEIRSHGGRAEVAQLDLRVWTSVEAVVEHVSSTGRRIDVLFANSGIAGPTASIAAVGIDEWCDTIAVNLTGTFLSIKAVLPQMLDRRSGSIVVIGSMTGKRPLPYRTPYAASKMGLVGLVRSAAAEVGPYGVRINLVSPGAVSGDRLDRVIADQAATRGVSVETARLDLQKVSMLSRAVSPEDVAAATIFLGSDEAASITGEDLNVSAGAVYF